MRVTLWDEKIDFSKYENLFADKTVLITGGTGSFGKAFAKVVLTHYRVRKLIIYSRDELKQFDMSNDPFFREHQNKVRFFIGDVRDKERVHRALTGVDYVIHAAALKQVPSCEYNPFEAIKTNVLGAENIINEAIDSGVKKVLALSTDKAANPINLYGATKLCSDKLFIAGNAYSKGDEQGERATKFAVVRYGNVVGSRGSVIPFFKEQAKNGVLPITDERMTRFMITLKQGVYLVIRSLELMHGGELFIPKIPSIRITDLAKVIAPKVRTEVIGIRPGEKLHEVLLPKDEAQNAFEFDSMYVIEPNLHWWNKGVYKKGKRLPEGFEYNSENNERFLSESEIAALVNESDAEEAYSKSSV